MSGRIRAALCVWALFWVSTPTFAIELQDEFISLTGGSQCPHWVSAELSARFPGTDKDKWYCGTDGFAHQCYTIVLSYGYWCGEGYSQTAMAATNTAPTVPPIYGLLDSNGRPVLGSGGPPVVAGFDPYGPPGGYGGNPGFVGMPPGYGGYDVLGYGGNYDDLSNQIIWMLLSP